MTCVIPPLVGVPVSPDLPAMGMPRRLGGVAPTGPRLLGMFDLARVDLDELVMALSDRDVSDHQWLIDPATGVLHLWSEDVGLDGDDRVDADSLEETGLQAIEPIASRDWYRVMADFADQLSDTFAQAELSIALRGRGAFRRFRDVLHERHLELVGPWRAYEQARGHHLEVDWLRSEGLVDPSAATDFIDAHPAPSVP